jgi:hypothetical protein
MTEDDYLNTQDLTRVRIAIQVLEECMDDGIKKIARDLERWRRDLYARCPLEQPTTQSEG